MEELGDRKLEYAPFLRGRTNLTAIVDACPLAVMLLAPDGTVRLWNPACERLFGWSTDEVIGQFLPSIPGERLLEYKSYLQVVLRGEAFTGVEAVRQRKDGTPFDVAIWAVPVVDADGLVCCLSMVADISERKRAERVQAFLAEVGDVLASSLDYAETVNRICRLTVPIVADFCQVYVDDGAGYLQRMAIAHAKTEHDVLARALVRQYPLELAGDSPAARAVRTGQTVVQPRLDDEALEIIAPDPNHRRILASLYLGSAISLPMRVRGKTVGALVLARGQDSVAYQDADVNVAEELARRAGLAVENARLFESEQQARREAERAADRVARLQAITAALVERLTPHQIATVVVEQAIGALGADRGAIGLLVEDGAFFEVVRVGGYPETESVQAELRQWERFPVSRGGTWAEVARTGHSVFHSSGEERVARHPYLARTQEILGLNATATLPLTIGGRTIGVLWLNFPGPHDFHESDREFLLALASHCSQAMERAALDLAEQRSRQKAEQAAEQMGRLQAVTARLAAAATQQEVAAAVASEAIAAFGARAAAVIVVGEDGKSYHAVHRDGYSIDTPDQIAVSQRWDHYSSELPTPTSDAIESGEPVILESADERLARYPHLAEVSTIMGDGATATVPLLLNGHPVGALHLVFPNGRSFSAEERALLLTLGRLCAQAFERARLYTQATEAVNLRDEFLSVAAHELKTPMTALRGSVQLLLRHHEKQGTIEQDRLSERLRVINEQSVKISRLVDQLLDVSRIEAGRLTVDRAPADLAPLVQGVAAAAQERSEGHVITVQAEGPLIASVDALRLEQVLTNLLDNAIKYSPHGGPIELAVTSLTPEQAVICVTDHGIGIPPEHRPRIFDRFFQAHAGQYLGGMGLGLYISRQIVDLHGGTLEAEFPESGGTRFVVRLPIAR